jgi:hypothetical protein
MSNYADVRAKGVYPPRTYIYTSGPWTWTVSHQSPSIPLLHSLFRPDQKTIDFIHFALFNQSSYQVLIIDREKTIRNLRPLT